MENKPIEGINDEANKIAVPPKNEDIPKELKVENPLDNQPIYTQRIHVYSKKEKESELFDQAIIDKYVSHLEETKLIALNSDYSKKTSQDFWRNQETYRNYYRCEISDTIQQFNYGETSQAQTRKIKILSVEELKKEGYSFKSENTKSTIESKNALETAAELSKKNIKCAIVNPADTTKIAGGVLHGTPNFEEDLARISDLGIALFKHAREDGDIKHDDEDRPLYGSEKCVEDNEALITSNVRVIKKIKYKEGEFWYFKEFEKLQKADQFKMAIVSNVAIQLKRGRTFTNEERELTTIKIRSQLTALIKGGIEVPLLGDFGCGAFNNPPAEIAEIYYELLYREGYANFFNEIRFNIINKDNCAVFQQVFTEQKELDLKIEPTEKPPNIEEITEKELDLEIKIPENLNIEIPPKVQESIKKLNNALSKEESPENKAVADATRELLKSVLTPFSNNPDKEEINSEKIQQAFSVYEKRVTDLSPKQKVFIAAMTFLGVLAGFIIGSVLGALVTGLNPVGALAGGTAAAVVGASVGATIGGSLALGTSRFGVFKHDPVKAHARDLVQSLKATIENPQPSTAILPIENKSQ